MKLSQRAWPTHSGRWVLCALALVCLSGGNADPTLAHGAHAAGPAEVPSRSLHPTSPRAWSFGVMADTQWGVDNGKNPNSVAVDFINQINARFIAKGVKFVIQVGDLTSNGTRRALDTRATYAQALYNAGIGFYPLRGNHEPSAKAAAEFQRIFPQTGDGRHNLTPPDAMITTRDDAATRPVAKTGEAFTVGRDFSSPSPRLAGLSYSFSYRDTRFVLIDQFFSADGQRNPTAHQLSWIDDVLGARPAGGQAFVFGHKGLIQPQHRDGLFGADPAEDAASQDRFITSLVRHGVHLYVSGHDHIHNRSLFSTSDGKTARIGVLTCASDSSKFYRPERPSNDDEYDVPAFGHRRETPIVQERERVGFYVFTVDDPRVTIDYFSAEPAPQLSFSKRETFGYALGGKEFVIPQGASYSIVQDRRGGVQARILAGENRGSQRDGAHRPLAKTVHTGWTEPDASLSPVLSLWMTTSRLGSDQTDTYVLAMTYPALAGDDSSSVALGMRDESGGWVNAVAVNHTGQTRAVDGPWQPGYSVGTYGVDPTTHTAWAVIDHDGEFAVVRLERAP